MKRYVLLLSLSLGSLVQMHAQSLEECRSEWNESSANVSDNIRYTSLNPSRISFNSYKNKGVAKLDYTIDVEVTDRWMKADNRIISSFIWGELKIWAR